MSTADQYKPKFLEVELTAERKDRILQAKRREYKHAFIVTVAMPAAVGFVVFEGALIFVYEMPLLLSVVGIGGIVIGLAILAWMSFLRELDSMELELPYGQCSRCGAYMEASSFETHSSKHKLTQTKRCSLCKTVINLRKIRFHNRVQHGIDSAEILQPESRNCSFCRQPIFYTRLFKHTKKCHQSEFGELKHALTRSPLLTGIRPCHDNDISSPTTILIDGLNVVRFRGEEHPKLKYLLSLVLGLLQSGKDCLTICDANTRHTLREKESPLAAEIYEGLRDKSDCFSESRKEQRADDYLLVNAHLFELSIISNDRFSQYYDLFPWLQRSGRRQAFSISPDGKSIVSGSDNFRIFNDLVKLRSQIMALSKRKQTVSRKEQQLSLTNKTQESS